MATLLFQGHASCRIVTDGGMVIYIDPSVGGGYDLPADLVLITHAHGDHNRPELVTQNPNCSVICAADALAGGGYNSFDVGEAHVEAVPAENKNHPSTQCVGFLLTVDGITLYHAGDTSTTAAMSGDLAGRKLDWALLPTDGIYNMGPEEASACAIAIGAKHTIPIHTDPSYEYSPAQAAKFDCPGRYLLAHGESVQLN